MSGKVQPRRRWHCDGCGDFVAGSYQSRWCVRCRPHGGPLLPWGVFVDAVIEGVRLQTPPAEVAAQMGYTAAALQRRLYRRGRPDLGRYFSRAAVAERSAARHSRADDRVCV